MYTIFINDLTLHLTKIAPTSTHFLEVDDEIEIWLAQYWPKLWDTKAKGSIIIYHPEVESLWEAVQKKYTTIEAAGGLVVNGNGEILFIHRLGKWDLPKGKLEEGEDIPTCALREVEEECGIQGHAITGDLPDTFHTYFLKGKPILKRTYWFQMEIAGVPDLIPQTEEDITECVWLPENKWAEVERNTYPSIAFLLERYRLGNE